MIAEHRTQPAIDRLPEWWDTFRNALITSGNNRAYALYVVREKAVASDLERLLTQRPDLKKQLEQIPAVIEGKLVSAAWARAVDGWEEPIYQGGKYVGDKRKYSDSTLAKLLVAYVAKFNPKLDQDTGVTPELVDAVVAKLREAQARDGSGRPGVDG
jgi:hypothetical protein